MNIIPFKTDIVKPSDKLSELIDKYIPEIPENSVLAITSKIVGLCENRVIPVDETSDKRKLIKDESEYWLDEPTMYEKYHIDLTIKGGSMVASAGIDESNGNDNYILWPENPDRSVDDIWAYLKASRKLNKFGIIITDSRTTPLRWGVTAFAISWCGFKALKSYIGKPDLFGRPFVFEQTSMIDSLATAAALVMGEGSERIPFAIITEIPDIEFQDRIPTPEERQSLYLSREDDIYGALVNSPKWKKGGKSSR